MGLCYTNENNSSELRRIQYVHWPGGLSRIYTEAGGGGINYTQAIKHVVKHVVKQVVMLVRLNLNHPQEDSQEL